jgi:oligopeptide transport system permease protein
MSLAHVPTAAPATVSAWTGGWRRFRANRGGMMAAGVLLLLAFAAAFGPWLSPYGYAEVNKEHLWAPPLTQGHLLGADWLGRDLLARLLAGLGVSLLVGLTATLVAMLLGVAYGAISGMAGGRVDELMMRLVDGLYALPFIFFVILLTVLVGRSLPVILLAIGAVEWLTMARIVRGQTLALKEREFVQAARAIGVSPAGLIVRHIGPNLAAPVLTYAALTVPSVVLAESFLSFLGLGVQEPLTSLGVLVAEGSIQMETASWLLLFPALVMAALLLSLNVLGDALREALDASEDRV